MSDQILFVQEPYTDILSLIIIEGIFDRICVFFTKIVLLCYQT